MEKNNDLLLLRPRSIAAVVRDGYRLYMGNFRQLFRASWPMALLYALAFAWLMSNMVYYIIPLHVVGLWHAISFAAFCLSALLLASYALAACREHKQSGSISRPKHWWGTWPPLSALVWIIKSVRWGFTVVRHWGMLFATLLVTAIITLLLTFFCELPGVIIGTANVKAYAGMFMGDELGMPDYLPTLTFVAFTIAGFIQAYVHLATIFPFYYAYGSIEQQRQERKQLNNIQTT